MELCNVNPENIVVHLIGNHSTLISFLEKRGISYIFINRFGDGKYCNKIAQLDSPLLLKYRYIVLCDCDIAFTKQIADIIAEDKIIGKIVNLSLPPLEIAEQLFIRYHLPLPETAPTLSGPTFTSNFNGGLYIGPKRLFKILAPFWKAYAHSILHDNECLRILGRWRNHIDQISFCMAIHKADIKTQSLPIEYNFPLPMFQKTALSLSEFYQLCPNIPHTSGPINIIHYHNLLDESYHISCTTDDSRLQNSIDRINSAIAKLSPK